MLFFISKFQDECSFVSLRDVDRVLSVTSWFYNQSQGDRTLFDEMDDRLEVDDRPEEGMYAGPESEDEVVLEADIEFMEVK